MKPPAALSEAEALRYATPVRLRDMVLNERPQERLERLGPAALSDTELLAMLLRSGSSKLDVLGLSQRLIAEAGSLAGLLRWSQSDFQKLPGIGKVKALQLLTVTEVARRILAEGSAQPLAMSGPDNVLACLRPHAAGLEVEKFWTLCLNRKNHLLKRVEVTSGTASSSLVHPREVFREAIRQGASAIIIAHNHPSGDPTPSKADILITKQLLEASATVGIDLLDHIIIGERQACPQNKGYYSFSEAGLL